MQFENPEFWSVVVSALTFPLYLQGPFLAFAWGAYDPALLAIGKRLFLLLPTLAFLLACWVSIASLLTVIFRQHRRDFVTAIFITWWDLGKAIAAFWGGIFRFVLALIVALFEAVKLVLFGVWTLIQELLLTPFRLMGHAGQSLLHSRIPWIAVSLTLLWTLIETTIFTYVMTPLVIDTFSNITGETFSEFFIRIPLFIFLYFVVLGSYAVLATFIDAVKDKDVGAILGIGAVEIIVMLLEVVFLYREFVDSLVPWLAQHSENFELGIFGTLAIAGFAWFAIRSLSWFLFASYGTPTILSIIKGKGLAVVPQDGQPKARPATYSPRLIAQIKSDLEWLQEKGEELLAVFMLPPLQVVAAAINFCTLLVRGTHLFEIPFKSFRDITDSATLLRNMSNPDVAPVRSMPARKNTKAEAGFSMAKPEVYHQ